MAFKNPLGPNFENSRVACKLLFFTKRSEEIYKPLKELSNFGFCSNLVGYRNVDEWPSKFSDFFVKSLWSSGRAYILHARGPRFECQPSQLFFLNLCVCNLKGYCLAFLMLSKSIQMKKCRLLKENNDDKMKKKIQTVFEPVSLETDALYHQAKLQWLLLCWSLASLDIVILFGSFVCLLF